MELYNPLAPLERSGRGGLLLAFHEKGCGCRKGPLEGVEVKVNHTVASCKEYVYGVADYLLVQM
jgi:hypothetical protein